MSASSSPNFPENPAMREYTRTNRTSVDSANRQEERGTSQVRRSGLIPFWAGQELTADNGMAYGVTVEFRVYCCAIVDTGVHVEL